MPRARVVLEKNTSNATENPDRNNSDRNKVSSHGRLDHDNLATERDHRPGCLDTRTGGIRQSDQYNIDRA